MRENKRIEKELLFKNNIKDITSISIDSDFKIENKEVIGNFLISGEYKIHEISLNREKFNFRVPFKYELDGDIDLDTVNVEITNFVYDYNKDELMVNIEYDISGDRKDVLIFDDEESLDDFLNSREVEVVDTRMDDIKNEITNLECKDKEDVLNVEMQKNENDEDVIEVLDSENEILDKEDRDMINKDEIINNVNVIEDGFVTYKIYKIKENETLESIVVKNKTTIDELKEYNDLNNLNVNDKIIIPYYE